MTGVQLAWLTTMLWAGQLLLIRLASRSTSPFDGFIVATWVAGAVGAVTLLWNGRPPQVIHLASGFAAASELAGMLGLLTLFLALHNAPVTAVSVVVSLYPVLAAVGGWVLLEEPMSYQQMLGMGLSTIGVVLVLSAR